MEGEAPAEPYPPARQEPRPSNKYPKFTLTLAIQGTEFNIVKVKYAKEGYDVICPSRYMKGGQMHGGPFIKKSLSKLAGCSIYWLSSLPTHDITNSYKLYKKSYLDEITLESTGGFEIGMEITAKAHKKQKKIVEIPSQWWDRTQGKSNFKLLKWLPKYLKWYLYVLSPCCLIKQR